MLIEGENGVISTETIDPHVDATWVYTTTHTYSSEMIMWCIRHNANYGDDFCIQTYRLKGRDQNSHRWYFKNPEVATLFSLIFS